jgi:hypothetical protein
MAYTVERLILSSSGEETWHVIRVPFEAQQSREAAEALVAELRQKWPDETYRIRDT